MKTWFPVLLALGLVAGLPVGSADAKGKKNKLCVATQIDGKKQTFKCKSTEKCCFDYVVNKGACKPATSLCLL